MKTMFFEASSFNQDIAVEHWQRDEHGTCSRTLVVQQTSMIGKRTSRTWPHVQGQRVQSAHWQLDTSSVTDMRSMFRDAAPFNQDLSGWCVSLITSAPSGFDAGVDGGALIDGLGHLPLPDARGGRLLLRGERRGR